MKLGQVENEFQAWFYSGEQNHKVRLQSLLFQLNLGKGTKGRNQQFGCSIDAAQQQMALNFELVLSDQLSSLVLTA